MSDKELARLGRLYAALSGVNQAIVRTATTGELFARVCEALVDQGGFRMVWIGWHDAERARLVPVAERGDVHGYLERLVVSTRDDPQGRGPSGVAFRSGEPCVRNDLLADPTTGPWRAELERSGFRSSAALPIRLGGQVQATLNVYSELPGFFEAREVALLTEAALDVSFALDTRAREEERLRAVAAVERLGAIVESTDDAVVGEALDGTITSWNPAAARLFGFAAAEVLGRSSELLVPPELLPEERALRRRIAAGERLQHFETVRLRRDGARFPAAVTISPIRQAGGGDLVGASVIVRDISARMRAEDAAQRERRFVDTLIESVPGILYLYDQRGRFLRWSRSFERASGYDAEEMARRHPLDFFRDDDRARVAERIEAVFRGEEASVEASFVAKDGQAAPYFFTGRRVELDGEPCLVGVGVDITERRRAEEALRRSEGRLRATLDGVLEGCQLIGPDWRYLYLNDVAAAHNRRPNAELLGRTMSEAWPGIEATEVHAMLRRSLEERVVVRREVRFVFPDGTEGWFDVRSQPAPEGVLVLSVDVTQRRSAERALRQLNEDLERKVAERTLELEAARARAESADRLKSAFLATMSHELRTPLNSIIGFTGILLKGMAGPLTPEQGKQLGMVQGSARHLLELINDVLDISKIEAGQLEVRLEPFDLRASIERTITSVRPLADKKGLTLEAAVPAALPPLESDRRRVEQVLLNLLNNAIKFTERGGVRLEVELVGEAAAGACGAEVRVRVVDTGIGIKAEDLDLLFRPFRQLDSSLQRQHEGTGLGLAICRRLADLLGGSVRAESEWGRGSVFTLTLPLGRA